MTSALMLVTAATLGWGNPAEFRRLEPNDLLAVTFVAQRTLEANRALEPVSPEEAALEIWYPAAPAQELLDVTGPSATDARRDTRYDLRLPFFRFKA